MTADPPRDGVRAAKVVDHALVLVLDNTLDAIEGGRLRILRHLEPLGLSALTINRLEVVFEELVSNVVRHGFGPETGRSILVVIAADTRAVHLTIEDDGRPFNPLEVEEAPAFSSLENARIGGLGVPVVRRFSTSVDYQAEAPSAAWSDLIDEAGRPVNRVRATIAAQP